MEEDKKPEGIPSPFVPGAEVDSTKVPDATQERDDRCIPIAREFLKLLASKEDLLMGSDSKKEAQAADYYSEMYVAEVMPYLIAKQIKIKEVAYIFSLMSQAINFLSTRTTMSIDYHFNNAQAAKWDLNDIDDLRVDQLQDYLVAKSQEVKTKKDETTGDK